MCIYNYKYIHILIHTVYFVTYLKVTMVGQEQGMENATKKLLEKKNRGPQDPKRIRAQPVALRKKLPDPTWRIIPVSK